MGRWSTVEKPVVDEEHLRADPVAFLELKEWDAREKMVKVAEAKVRFGQDGNSGGKNSDGRVGLGVLSDGRVAVARDGDERR